MTKKLPLTILGPHLMLDCHGCNPDKIADLSYIFNFLDELPDKIGMTKITQPYVFPYSGLVPEDKGVTGIVIIAESHLSFHSFTEKDYFFFDLFSCMPFDMERTRKFVLDVFEVKEADTHYIERGRGFPRSRNIIVTKASQAAKSLQTLPCETTCRIGM